MAVNIKQVITGAITIIVGLILLPVAANFKNDATVNMTNIADWRGVSETSGLSSITNLIIYGFGFGLVGVGIAMIYWGKN